jgi:heme-degrading monooxygenase HmoA
MGDASVWTSGNWVVQQDKEDEFVREWTGFVEWAKKSQGAGSFVLIRQVDDPRRFISFGSWADMDSIRKWRENPEFPQRLGKPRGLCDEFEGKDYTQASKVR